MTLFYKQLTFSHLIIYRRIFQFIPHSMSWMYWKKEVVQELFEDIPNFEQQMEALPLLNKQVTQAEHYL